MEIKKSLKIEKNWQYYLGIVLFICSWILWLASVSLLFFKIPLGKLLGIIAALIISSEIIFVVSLVLLGKTFAKIIEAKIKKIFLPHKANQPIKPVSKTRHYIGIVLFFLSFIPSFIVEVSLFFGYPKTEYGHIIMLISVLFGYTMFIVSLFILGGGFWDRLIKLFQWPEPVPEKNSTINKRSSL